MIRLVRYNGLRISVLIMLATLGGCAESQQLESEDSSAAVDRLSELPPAVVYPQMFFDSFLLANNGEYRWRLSPERFVLESLGGPLPAEVTQLMFADRSDDYRIEGDWSLTDEGEKVTFSNLQADTGTPRDVVVANLEFLTSERLKLGGQEYQFAQALPLREVLPDYYYRGRVVEVIDGNRLRIRDQEGTLHNLKLSGIVCPSKDQPHGEAAADFAKELTGDRLVFVKVFGMDGEAEIAQVWVLDLRYLNMELLAAGLAWHDKRVDDEWMFATTEDDARTERRGLWADEEPVPPWRWASAEEVAQP